MKTYILLLAAVLSPSAVVTADVERQPIKSTSPSGDAGRQVRTIPSAYVLPTKDFSRSPQKEEFGSPSSRSPPETPSTDRKEPTAVREERISRSESQRSSLEGSQPAANARLENIESAERDRRTTPTTRSADTSTSIPRNRQPLVRSPSEGDRYVRSTNTLSRRSYQENDSHEVRTPVSRSPQKEKLVSPSSRPEAPSRDRREPTTRISRYSDEDTQNTQREERTSRSESRRSSLEGSQPAGNTRSESIKSVEDDRRPPKRQDLKSSYSSNRGDTEDVTHRRKRKVSDLTARPYYVQTELETVKKSLAFNLSSSESEDVYHAKLLRAQLDACGSLCKSKLIESTKNVVMETNSAKIECPRLFLSDAMDSRGVREIPPKAPRTILEAVTMGGDIILSYPSLQNATTSSDTIWDQDSITDMSAKVQNKSLRVSAGSTNVNNVYKAASQHFKNKHILTVYNNDKWLPAALLAAGASSVYCVEFGQIRTTHPNITVVTPLEFNERFLNGTLPFFDAGFIYSKFSTIGLGASGEVLNPYGDITSVAKVWCALPKGAPLIVSLPVNPKIQDVTEWKTRRFYGPKRIPVVLTNLQVIDVYPWTNWHVLIVAKKRDPLRNG
eukprot:TRINITY_DN3374_c0_g1_i4.p1 TRINITY_DN3374_c0_g1~~TRINITY_DN3374_c0_g1_i4.p1  ORF type:complete len:613 (+),score=91.47 TRINITY_DN3374_c0_g1_i4:63-1901(+)